MQKKNTSRGFTLIEILLVGVIMIILATFSFRTFISYNNAQALDKDVKGIIAALDEARSKTVSSINDSQYGVHFATEQVLLFKGATYSSIDPANRSVGLSGQTTLGAILLSGGASDVVFERLTGKANATGTIAVTTKRSPSITKIITIYATGIFTSN
jgi:type II secretory pathway pseudopilin PulG